MSQEILPLAVWQSGTNNNSVPANDNALRVEVALKEAISIANSEPVSPSERDLHIVGTPWGGFTTNNAVIYLGGTWYEYDAFEGWFKTIAGDLYNFDGAAWNLVTGGGGGGIPEAPSDGKLYGRKDAAWEEVPAGGSETLTIVTEASAFTAAPPTHAGLTRYIRAGGDVTFDSAEGYTAGQVFNIRATDALSLVGSGVALTPTTGGTLDLEAGMAVTVVMVTPTTADVIGLTVAA